MDKISEQIEEMAGKLEKASADPKEKLFDVIKSLGKQGLKDKLATLSDDEKITLKATLEEMTLEKGRGPDKQQRKPRGSGVDEYGRGPDGRKVKGAGEKSKVTGIKVDYDRQKESNPDFGKSEEVEKATTFDKEAQSAKMIQGKVTDTIIQEDIASDDADEKLVKPEAAQMNHQGTPTDGWDGQVIKAKKDDEPKEKKAAKKIAEAVDEMAEGEAEEEVKDHEKKMHKGEKYSMPKKDALKEHKRLVGVLESDDKKDDKKEAKIQRKELKEMKKSEIELIEENLDEVVAKAMDKCNDDKMVMKKLKEKGMDEKKVQGALEKYKMKKSEAEAIEKGKMKEKAVEADDVEKAKMNKEEDQLGDAPEMKGGKQVAKKTAAPDIEDNAKANKKNMTKSCSWEDQNRLLKANTQGRNFNFNVEQFVTETLANEGKPSTEIKKAQPKEDLNDIIEKSMDRNWDQVNHERRMKEVKTSGTLTKSFDEIKDLAAVMGISEEEAKKILGQ